RATPRPGAATVVGNANDDIEKQARALRELIERFKLTANGAGISVWEWDLVRDQVRTDARMINPEIYGSIGELVDRRQFLNETLHPEDREPFILAMENVFHSTCEQFTHRYRVRRPDGGVSHLQLHGRAFRDSEGKALRLFGLNLDITEQSLVAAKLDAQQQEQNELLRHLQKQTLHVQALLDRISVATEAAGLYAWEADAQTRRLVWVGKRFKAFGLDAPSMSIAEYEDAMYALIAPEDLQGLQETATRAYEDGSQTYTCRFRMTRDGMTRHMLAFAHIARDEHGRALRLIGATADVTNEVQTTALLQRQAEQERQLIERLNIATQAAGISSWEIDLANSRFLWIENPLKGLFDLVGPTEQDGSVARLLERVLPEDRGHFTEHLVAAFRNKQDRYSYRYRVHKDDGAVMHVQNHNRLLFDDSGQPVRVLGVSWDVTHEMEAAGRLELQAQEQRRLLERLSLSTEAAGISSWEVDLDTRRFVLVDDGIKTLHGVADFGGTTDEFFSQIYPEDRDTFLRAVAESVRTRRDRFSCRYRVPRPGREIGSVDRPLCIQTHVRVILDEAGRARRLLGVSWDITKEIEAAEQLRQQTEQLRDAERRLERASLSSSEGHWESDLVGKDLWFSSSYHALLGYPDGSLPKNAAEFDYLVHPDDAQAGRAMLADHFRKGTPFLWDGRMRTHSGKYRWFRHRGMVERDRAGQPLSMSGSIHDIHDQKLAEDALRLAQQRFERAINGTQDGLWELDADGAAWCSPRLAELLGYAPDELAADTNFLRSFLHPDDADTVAAATQSHFQQGEPYDVEIRLRMNSGDYRWYRARATAERDAAGRPLRLSGSLQDVTEARSAREELMRATQAAEAANRAKSEFLANVSHEIRTPLNGVVGMTGLLLDTMLDRTQRDYAETIRTSADSLLIVINDILDFSKIEAGRLDIEALELDLRGAVEDVGAMMAFQAAAKNLELVVHMHPDVPDRVVGDPQRVRQCLVNLVSNAIKFTRAGEIVIEVRNTGARDGRVLMQFEVRDTGIGVAADTLTTLFQPFVQADSSTTRHFGGTGLGLSIVRRLVQMMGGEVGASSELGRGSSFWFTLPLEPAAPVSAEAPIDLTRLGRRVLVVDDNETNRRVVAGQLMRVGYEVSLASGGIEAISLLRQAIADDHPFEVVLADDRMHDMDGAALGERINSDPQLSRSRIIMLTSTDRQGDIRRFAALGFAAYLTKPVRGRELLECMDRVLSRDAKEWHLRSQPIVTRGALAASEATRRFDGRVLLVEDNAVNQKVAVRFLERMGCSVRVADNGAEGLKAFGEATFDIVFMDLQMPVMDGLTATRRIRELETVERRTPIVALTANAMSGQLERCIEAGMDGFLTKPLEIARLHETLERFGFGVASGSSSESDGATLADSTPIHLAHLNELTDGDTEFAHELAMTFVASGEQVFAEIRDALSAFDRAALSRAAHKLKGASANIHADVLRDVAWSLEAQAANLDQQRLKELIAELEREFQRAAEFLKAHAPQAEKKAG
ncbi:MAG: PAS domain-containing protein, partial [Steroidobacter sp.]